MQVVWVRWHSLDRLSAVVAGHWLSLDGVVVGWWGQPLNFYSSLSLSLICPGCERYFLWFNAGKYMWSLGWLLLYNSLIRMGKLGRNSIPPVFFFFFFFSAAIVNCPFASRPRRDSRRWQEPHTKLGGAFDGFRFESQLVALERPLLFSSLSGCLVFITSFGLAAGSHLLLATLRPSNSIWFFFPLSLSFAFFGS